MGDRVKLTDKVAKASNRGNCPIPRRHVLDWTQRRGTVHSANLTQVSVKWDDRRSLDQWPIKALEKIE